MKRRLFLVGCLGLGSAATHGRAQEQSAGESRFPLWNAYLQSMRTVPAGLFPMGSDSGFPDERPVHNVNVSAFRMGATPVTVAMWSEYCAATRIPMPPAPRWGWIPGHPVVNVSWHDIMGVDGKGGYCAWVRSMTGVRASLPTEAQWEYAARGGNRQLRYPWGDKYDSSRNWCSFETSEGRTAPVTRTEKMFVNPFGLADMVGNVRQWCLDPYGPYLPQEQSDPVGPPDRPYRCLRGGSWIGFFDVPDNFRCTNRGRERPEVRDDFTGFRLVADAG